MKSELRIEKAHGVKIADYLAALAELRVTVFREYPYLYDGNLEYEAKYLQTYLRSHESLAVLVYDGDRAVAATTCIPLDHEVDEFKAPFVKAGYDINKLFYLGESVVLPVYRGRGLGVRFFQEREAHAKHLGEFETLCFCAVERPANHPRRPPNYQPLDEFWRCRGFEKRPELHTNFPWKELGEPTESHKRMVFWTRALDT